MTVNVTLFAVRAVLLLGPNAERIMAQYYSSPHEKDAKGTDKIRVLTKKYASVEAERDFEKRLYQKTHKVSQDILVYDQQIVVYKECEDVMLYVIGGIEENECMLFNVLCSIRDALELILQTPISSKALLNNYDLLALCVDETIDDGIILETEPTIIASRISKAPISDGNTGALKIDLSERGLLNVWGKAKEEIAERLLRSGF